MRRDKDKLRLWQDRLARNESSYEAERARMDGREGLYQGDRTLRAMVGGERRKETPHVRNICAELVEAQVSSSIPQPKVTARRKQDEGKAKLIEDMLRNELDRLPFEQLNDMMERTVPIQGGGAFLVEWDNTKRSHAAVGELAVSALHPKQIVPQAGVYTGVEDMDYIILKLPQTKEFIRRRYGVDVSDEGEREPEVKGADAQAAGEDMVTQYTAYYRNDRGGIGLYSWVNDTQLEDLEDYQARRLRRCAKCGAVEPMGDVEPVEPGQGVDPSLGVPAGYGALGGNPSFGLGPLSPPEMAAGGDMPAAIDRAMEELRQDTAPRVRRGGRKECPYCGGTKWEHSREDFEEIPVPILRSDGSSVGGMRPVETVSETVVDEMGLPVVETAMEPERIPFYKPDIYPVLLQRNVSVYGRFLGDSDLDKIADQQNTTNRLSAKIIDKLVKSGSYMSLPDDASIKADAEDMKVIRPGNPASAQLINVYDLEGRVQQDMAYLDQVYQEARQTIGITDSFQGRHDATATSGKAKEFAAAQSAGRLESKRVMKNAAYAALFEAMFKFKLAYADEPRPVVSHDDHGNAQYQSFNRYDFLERDEAGEWWWNDQFLFSCDTSAPLASNREAMWQETRMNLQSGAFGDPAQLQTLILFWSKMELLHYPGAGETKAYLEEELKRQQAAAQMQQQMVRQQQLAAQVREMAGRGAAAPNGTGSAGIDPMAAQVAVRQAQADAAKDLRQTSGGIPLV